MRAKRLDNALISQADWSNEVTIKNLLKTGHLAIGFYSWDDTMLPIVKAGSSIEVNGDFYVFDSSAILEMNGDDLGEYYIRTDLEPFRIIGDSSIKSLPEWDPKRKGYYDSGNRIIGSFEYTGFYIQKKLYMGKCLEKTETLNSSFTLIEGHLIDVDDPKEIENYFFGIAPIKETDDDTGEEIESVIIYRTADKKYYEKLHEMKGSTGNIEYANGIILSSIQVKMEEYEYLISKDNKTFSDPYWSLENTFSCDWFLYNNGVWLVADSQGKTSFSTDLEIFTTSPISNNSSIKDVTAFKDKFILHSTSAPHVEYSENGRDWLACTIDSMEAVEYQFIIESDVLYICYSGIRMYSSIDGIDFIKED